MFAISQQAQTSLRSIIGQSEMDQLLSERDSVNRELRRIIDEPTEGPWGVRVERVEIKDVSLPESMKRSMSRQAEAERERRARIITADGEYQASKRLAAAANVMARDPAALQLRLLQTVVEVAAEKNSTLVMPVPVELLRFFDKFTPTAPAADRKSAADSASLADFGVDDAAKAEVTSEAPPEIPKVPPIPESPMQAGNGKLAAAAVPQPGAVVRTTTTPRNRAHRLRFGLGAARRRSTAFPRSPVGSRCCCWRSPVSLVCAIAAACRSRVSVNLQLRWGLMHLSRVLRVSAGPAVTKNSRAPAAEVPRR